MRILKMRRCKCGEIYRFILIDPLMCLDCLRERHKNRPLRRYQLAIKHRNLNFLRGREGKWLK